ncbi:XRE family transcriptional regulator, partial [[Clostridium] leptum]
MVEDIKTLTPGQIDSLNKTISEFKIANKFKKP